MFAKFVDRPFIRNICLHDGKTKIEAKKDEEESMVPTKEEYAISKYLRFSVPAKKANMFGSKVQYFVASKAVDTLLASKWATSQNKNNVLFTTRESCVAYLNVLLQKNIFHRVRKFVKVMEILDKTKKSKSAPKSGSSKKATTAEPDNNVEKSELRRRKKGPDPKESENDEATFPSESEKGKKSKKENDSNKSATDDKEKGQDERQKKKDKKKVKLELHETQVFIDGQEQFYVWVYDPVPLKTWILGFFIVIGAIVICLFPLWPPQMRTGVYYLSLAGAGFLGVILSLALLRYVVYGVLWALTLGRHQLWLLPNLLEDVGFVESFIPIYTYKWTGKGCEPLLPPTHDNDSKKKKKKKKVNTENEEELRDRGQNISSTKADDNEGATNDPLGEAEKDTEIDNKEQSNGSPSKNGGEDFEMIEEEEKA